MSIWNSLSCPVCKEAELSVATCYGWLRLTCPNKKCFESWIVILQEKNGIEIDRQLALKVTRTEFEKDMEAGIKKLKGSGK